MAFAKPVLVLLLFLGIFNIGCNAQGLKVGYYKQTCPNVEAIVKRETARIMSVAPSLGAPLLRMHFHDCFVRGCDGSVLLNSTNNNQAEKDAFPNLSLRGFGSIDRVKSAVEKQCPGVVSCADTIALVARDVVSLLNGPFWRVPLGRRDGRVSNSSEVLANLPPPSFNITQLKAAFAAKGLNTKDLVVLSGSHTIGTSHCSSFSNRLYNFTGRGDSDPSLDSNYAVRLRSKCAPGDQTTLVEMDPGNFKTFDETYYTLVTKRRGLFTSDSALLDDSETRAYVLRQATAKGPTFLKDFAKAMVKMGKIGVLTGNQGEIRRRCAFSQILIYQILCCNCFFFQYDRANAQNLTTNFYRYTCPNLETIVNQTTASFISPAPSLAASLLRMHFHDCFVRGCDGSVLLNSTANNTAEKDAIPNQSLRGFQVIDAVKSEVERRCPGIVSCADILALVARDAVRQGGPFWRVPTGRRDGVISNASEAASQIPAPTSNFSTLQTDFANKGLNLKDLVLLSGAHTIGISHCTSFSRRLYNFTGVGDQDPALDSEYAANLRARKCRSINSTAIVEMDPGSFRTFDLSYYTLVLKRRGLFQSDAALLTDSRTRSVINQLVQGSLKGFYQEFAESMEKMGRIDVKTGSAGEIRKHCAFVNS
ncbi:Peroxidase [Handroanthus impetiginosus]|uniref:peroxidase n=1 Tax=Handroanthus impetiginosus TaxID=429701 RepID=A0A2G9HLB0_9LAMI|nr:Peroxidase [Handroanthus impetiginosus]